MDDEQAEKARLRLEAGSCCRHVAEELQVSYSAVQRLAWDSEALSWRRAKRVISHSVRKLETATRAHERKALAETIEWYAEYLCRCACRLRDEVDATRELLESQSS